MSVPAVASVSANESFTARLAAFFPDAVPVRMPVRVIAMRDRGDGWSEETVIEFGTPQEAIFACGLSLEIEDRVRLEQPDGSMLAEASVVAVQYHEGRCAVAARFLREVPSWIVKR